MPPPDDPTGAAIESAMAALAEKTRWQRELADELARAAAEREEVEQALYTLIRTLPEGERRAARADVARLTRDLGAMRGRCGMTRRTRAMLEFLVESEHEEIRAAELNFYLRRLGLEQGSRYAASTLSGWAKQGIVTRTGHGTYRLNRLHPQVLHMNTNALEKRVKSI